ncbi:MAG: hypothetical protein KatS3mg104_1646 [Phycisphaerae bacterium]|nr:MAG: hypothetical protein KatS3mg104_1646 [Phycisphaerae bacterium]
MIHVDTVKSWRVKGFGMSKVIEKRCVYCGTDVAKTSRIKDSSGCYYCEECYSQIQNKHNLPKTSSDSPASLRQPKSDSFFGSWQKRWGLREKVICPHCWYVFPPESVLWVAQHIELLGDTVLGPEALMRFLPSRFTPQGHAIDARGSVCQTMACPKCHLSVPRHAIEMDLLFASIIGVPSSGKSYFLTSMVWQLRQILPNQFGLSFADADTVSNRSLNEYEETLFLAPDPDALVAIRKTETEGELYDQIRLGEQTVHLPRPFLFSIRPLPEHLHYQQAKQISRVICMYDNAGEHFLPGSDNAGSMVTHHLARSRILMFMYDPTQDPRFRQRCLGFSKDPQLQKDTIVSRQEVTLTEASHRVRKSLGLSPTQKHKVPLIVIIPKYDVWASLLDVRLGDEPYIVSSSGQTHLVDTEKVEFISNKVRHLLWNTVPDLVFAAEDFCETVIYIPCSATGCSPEIDESGQIFGLRPRHLKPQWVAVPFMYALARMSIDLVFSLNQKQPNEGRSRQ